MPSRSGEAEGGGLLNPPALFALANFHLFSGLIVGRSQLL